MRENRFYAPRDSDADARQIKVISPAGKQVDTLKLPFGPEALGLAPDGTIYTGGEGRLVRLDRKGKIVKETKMPENAQVPQSEQRRAFSRPQQISGIAVSGQNVFVAFGAGWSLMSKSKLFRFDLDLKNPKLLDEGLRGCCQRCDIAARDGVIYVAENAAHRVVAYDSEGKVQSKWGERSRTDLAGFGSCCNPMNLAFDAQGTIYTAESGMGRVKCYTTAGKFLGLVGYIGVERFTNASGLAASCSNIAIAVTPKGERVYLVDLKNNVIRVLEKKT